MDGDGDLPKMLQAVLKALDYHNKIMMNDVISKATVDVEDGFWKDPVAVFKAAKWPAQVQNYLDSLDRKVEDMIGKIERAAALEVERKKKELEAKEEEDREKEAAELAAAEEKQKEVEAEIERLECEEQARLAADLLASGGKRRRSSHISTDLDVRGVDDEDADNGVDDLGFEDADSLTNVQAIRGKKTGGRKRKQRSANKPAEPSSELNLLSPKLEEDL